MQLLPPDLLPSPGLVDYATWAISAVALPPMLVRVIDWLFGRVPQSDEAPQERPNAPPPPFSQPIDELRLRDDQYRIQVELLVLDPTFAAGLEHLIGGWYRGRSGAYTLWVPREHLGTVMLQLRRDPNIRRFVVSDLEYTEIFRYENAEAVTR